MAQFPALTVDGFTYQSKGQPVLIWFPGPEVFEFNSLEVALSDLMRKRHEQRPGAHFARVFIFKNGAWAESPTSHAGM